MRPRTGWTAAPPLLAVSVILLGGCERSAPSPSEPPRPISAARPRLIRDRAELPPPTADRERREDRVRESCVRCHLFPPPDALPRAAWERQILAMTALPPRSDVDLLTPQEVSDALAWYEEHAPTEWSAKPPAPTAEPPRYRVATYTPAGLEGERIPAVAFLAVAPPDDPGGPALLAAEMRTRTLLRLPVGASEPTDLGLDSPGWNYPAHIAFADLDGDGRSDRVVAGLGGMNPTRDELGTVEVSVGGGPPRAVGPRLNRVSDARAGDLDGDGDLDFVAAAFGWRGEGRLVWLERGDTGSYRLRTIDERDGFVHAEPRDVDGDGDLDIFTVLAQEHEQTLLYRNEGAGRFTPILLDQGPHPGWGTSGLVVVDLDGDGDDDLVVAHGDTLDVPVVKPYHGLHWLENQGELTFVSHEIGRLPGCECVAVGDADGDGDLDVAAVAFLPQVDPAEWRAHDLDSVVLFEREGDGWVRHSLEKGDPLHPSVAMMDLDGDGDTDIAVGNFVWMDEGERPRHRRDYITVFYRE